MNAEEFKRKLEEYRGERESAFYWEEVPKTVVWHDENTNELRCDLGLSVKCDDYDDVWECVNDLGDAVAEYYREKGIFIHEDVPVV